MESIHDHHFYSRSLEHAKISRATHDDILQLKAHEIQSKYALSQNWKIDRNLSINDNELGVNIYTLYDESSMELSISFHSTPAKSHLALLADGEILREAGWYAPTGQGEQLLEMQRAALQETGLLNDEWHPQFALALSEAKRIKEQYEAAGYSVSVTGHGAGGVRSRNWQVTPWICRAMPSILWARRTSLNHVAMHSGAAKMALIRRKGRKTA